MNKMLSSIALLAITGNVLMAGGDIVPVEPVVFEESLNDEWKFSASINGWMPDITAKTHTKPSTINFRLQDILKNLNMTAMGTVTAQKGKWGFMTDMVYLNMSKATFVPIDPPVVLTNVKMKAWIVTPMATYRFMESENLTLDVLAGARYLNLNFPIGISYQTEELKNHAWDGIIGFKGNYDLNEKWFMPFLFDVGTGDIDLTWQAYAAVGYKYDNFDVIAGYRYLEWNFDESDTGGHIFKRLTVNGPIVGIKFHF